MKVKMKAACPELQKDGRYKVVLREVEEEVADLGRPETFCNVCGWSTYPNCIEKCPFLSKEKKDELSKM